MKDFLKKEVLPFIDTWEKEGEIPREVYKKFGEMGYLGLEFPEEVGGLDLDIWYAVVLNEELNKVNSGGFGAAIGAHFQLALTHLNAEGSENQKNQFLIPGIKGDVIGRLSYGSLFSGFSTRANWGRNIRDSV